MKRIITSVIVIGGFLVYSLFHNKSQDVVAPPATNTTTKSTSSEESLTPTTGTSVSLYKDGSYTGSAADAYYGNIQVKATISSGKLADVQFLQYPNDQSESVEINTRAMPLLTEEALQSQSANVDIVTRATDSSLAFRESLTSALSQAK